METISISLPPALEEFVDTQVSAGRFGTVSEYVRQLIRNDQQRAEREAIDGRLVEAIDGGSTSLTAEDWQRVRQEVQRRTARRAK
jgi:antitoxin ParD1/3/4